MSRCVAAWAVLLTTLSPMTASACWFGHSWHYTPCCCVVSAYYAVPVNRSVECKPAARSPAKLYATPQAAPPSGTAEPPLAKPGSSDVPRMPKSDPGTSSSLKAGVTTSSNYAANGGEATYFDSYAVARLAGGKAGGGERCSVGFWNLSERSITLKAGGLARVLPVGQNVTMELDREFTWQVEGREIRTSRLGVGDAALEIVIRR